MRYTFLVTLITFGTSFTKAGHIPHNDSSVVVTYSGHAEAVPPKKSGTCKSGTCKTGTTSKSDAAVKDSDYLRHGGEPGGYGERHNKDSETDAPGVVFIPSGNQDVGEYASKRDNLPPRREEVKLKDVLTRQTLNDMINHPVRVETETPPAILFISGKNNENMERPKKEETYRRSGNQAPLKETPAPLDCKHLECNNTQASVCGVKLEHRKPKYRLFLNECYFRKVNCAFSYEYSRYGLAPHHKCDTVGSHFSGKVEMYEPRYEPMYIPLHSPRRVGDEEDLGGRRSFASRRALTSGADGERCEHSCPAHCRDDYSPECASSGLTLRVFMNHCQLDRHSCATGEAWQKRPLADCVGPRKAEVQNNRAFIGWMQRVGIVDTKGRMVLA